MNLVIVFGSLLGSILGAMITVWVVSTLWNILFDSSSAARSLRDVIARLKQLGHN